MSAKAAVTAVECLNNKMPFSLLHFFRPLLRRLQFSYQPLTFISFPPTQAPPKHPSFIQENEVKVQHGFKKIYAGRCTTWSSRGCESLVKENRECSRREVWTLDSGKAVLTDLSQHHSSPHESIRQRILPAIKSP